MQRNIIKALLLFVIIATTTSCNRKAQLLYLGNVQDEKFNAIQPPKYLLKGGDVLSVQVITQDANVSKLFNNVSGGNYYNAYSNEASAYITGYSVSDSGYVHLPILGKIKIVGLSINEAQAEIQKATEQYLKDGIVILKMLSFKVTVIGEVKRPGTYNNYKDYLNIFEAIGLAGDLSDYAERSTVLVVRQTKEGLKTSRINLNDKKILDFEAFYLLPNDIVIVEPRKGKVFAMNSPNISIFLSIVSTALLMMNFLK